MNKKQKLEQEYAKKSAKPRPTLLPSELIMEVIKVMEVGAIKYEKDDWKKEVMKRPEHFYDATLRHIYKHLMGERLDEEDSLSHLAHAVTNILYLLYREIQIEKLTKENLL